MQSPGERTGRSGLGLELPISPTPHRRASGFTKRICKSLHLKYFLEILTESRDQVRNCNNNQMKHKLGASEIDTS